jgi:hypothetical protein
MRAVAQALQDGDRDLRISVDERRQEGPGCFLRPVPPTEASCLAHGRIRRQLPGGFPNARKAWHARVSSADESPLVRR